MTIELTKSEKKIAAIIINKALQTDYEKSILLLDEIIDKWKSKKADNQEAYLALYKALTHRDKYIAQRYNGLSGSRYLITIVVLLADKVISENDLDDFRPELKNYIIDAHKIF